MKILKFFRLFLLFLFLQWMIIGVASQTGDACPPLVEEALQTVSEVCADTLRNQACYGNLTLIAEPQPNIPAFEFDSAGDKVNVTDIHSLKLNRMDETVPEWGIALMKVQANLPDTLPGQNATILLFGDVTLRAAESTPEIPITIQSDSPANIRTGPAKNALVITQFASQTRLVANGRNQTGDWLRLILPEGGVGWIVAFLVRTDKDIQSLPVVAEATPFYRTMQAFYLRTGIGDAVCQEAPNSGILIQTPKGAGKVEFLINEVNIILTSTAYIHSDSNGDMVIAVIEGEVKVTAFDVTRVVPAGAQVTVPLNDAGATDGPPGPVEPYTLNELSGLPITTFDDPVERIAPLTEEEVATSQKCTGITTAAANVRSGGGQAWPVIRTLPADTSIEIVGSGDNGNPPTWWQLADGGWVIGDFVQTSGDCDNVNNVTFGGAVLDVTSCMHEIGPKSRITPDFHMPIAILVVQRHTYSDEATAIAQYQNKHMTIDGRSVPLNHNLGKPYLSDEGYWVSASGYTWIPPEAGTYTIVTTGYENHACTITVQP